MALFNTLTDSFNGSAVDGTKWTSSGTTTTVTETGGQLVYTTSTTNGYGVLDGTTSYDLTGNYVLIQLPSAGNQALASLEVVPLSVFLGAGNFFKWYLNQNSLSILQKVGGVATTPFTTTYNSAIHRWFRIRESGGTTFCDHSSDGSVWANDYSVANPFAVTSLTFEASVGTFSNEASGTTVLMGNFNIPVSAKLGLKLRPHPFSPGIAR